MKLCFYRSIIYGQTAFLMACSPIKNSQYEEALNLSVESAECLTRTTYANPLAVTGTALFYKRGVNLVLESGQIKNLTLGDPLAAGLPIRNAEVAVTNSSNLIVQCGRTNEAGELKAVDGISTLQIPPVSDNYTVRVLSRMNITLAPPVANPSKATFKAHISVKKDIYTNQVHSVAKSFYSTGSEDISNVDVTAYARQTDSTGIEGGAFNILNSIYTTYDFIRNNTGNVDVTCLNDRLNVYWKPGFNPFQYSEPGGDPSYIANGSYYSKAEKNLYITGGRLGDISIDVTNHFDDFVIIHELSHHIENQCGQLLSPGGTHVILARIDPRLAWAEAWANFVAAEVMYDPTSISHINPEIGPKLAAEGLSDRWTYLFGSKGFSDSIQNIGNGTGFMFDLKKPGNNPDTWQYGPYSGNSFDKVDPSRYPGEGHFREGAITRGLFKLSAACGTYCTTSTPIVFEKFWKSMDKITGIGRPSFILKSSHDFLERVKSLLEADAAGSWAANYADFNKSQTSEALNLFSDSAFTAGGINRWIPYGSYLHILNSGSCINQTFIEPRPDDPVLTSTNSDQRYSNHFYTLDFSILDTVDEINVTFTKQNLSGTTTEFDILLLKADYFFNIDYACSATDTKGNCTTYIPSRTTTDDVLRSDRRSGAVATKTIRTLKSLDPTQKYVLNIRAYTPNKTIAAITDYSYVITNQAGLQLCP